MASRTGAPALIRFGAFELDAANEELRKAGVSLKLHPQPFRVLLLLAEHDGRAVTRMEIQHSLWDDNTFVDFDRGINFCINQILVALGDDAEEPHTLAVVGLREETLKVLGRVDNVPWRSFGDALVYTGLGEKDEAFRSLDKAIDLRAPSFIRLKVDPEFDSLRQDPRFQELLRRMNLPE